MPIIMITTFVLSQTSLWLYTQMWADKHLLGAAPLLTFAANAVKT